MLTKSPSTVLEALLLYAQSLPLSKRDKDISNLKSVLKKYLLPGYDFSPEAFQTKTGLNECLGQLSLARFRTARNIFKQLGRAGVRSGEIRESTFNNYYSHLNCFLLWMRSQDWYDLAIADNARTAPKLYSGHSISRSVRESSNFTTYRIKSEEFSETLKQQLYLLQEFWTVPFHPRRRDQPLRSVSINSYLAKIMVFLGWVKNVYLPGIDPDELNLELMTQVELVKEFVNWGLSERASGYAWASMTVKAAIFVTKWWLGINPTTTPAPELKRTLNALLLMGISPTTKQIEQLVQSGATDKLTELRAYHRSLEYLKSPILTRDKYINKLLTFEQLCSVIDYLKLCCAPRTKSGSKRELLSIRDSYQKYVLIKFLTYCPIRQREIRELELGRTLWRESSGYVVRLSPLDHKTGSATGLGREFPLPDVLTADLDEWLNVHRRLVETNHQFVFISLAAESGTLGKPLTEKSFHSVVTSTMKRATHILFGEPKAVSPHDFRRIAITHHRQLGKEEHAEALALVMGHSVKEADEIYNLMTTFEKAQKGLNWWQ